MVDSAIVDIMDEVDAIKFAISLLDVTIFPREHHWKQCSSGATVASFHLVFL
jgi:hypothetical protein